MQQENRACVYAQYHPRIGQTRTIWSGGQARSLLVLVGHISIVMGQMMKLAGKVCSRLKKYEFEIRSRGSVINILTRLMQIGRYVVRIPAKAKDRSPLKNVRTGSGVHPASFSSDSEVLSRW